MRAIRRVLLAISTLASFVSVLHAHGGTDAPRPPSWWQGWAWDPWVVSTLFFSGALYASGWRALQRRTASGIRLRGAAWCFAAGWSLLVLALVSPLHPWGQVFFSVHMVQHEVLMILAAPLLVLGRPGLVFLSALPRPDARSIVAAARSGAGRGMWRAIEHPFVAWLSHAVALWIWHVPVLFEATLRSEAVHALQHASFLGTALLFWQAVIFGPRRRFGYGVGVLYLFTTAVHSGALGALLTFAQQTWYPGYASNPGVAGLSALEDQQLGGLIMWIPAGIIYLGAALTLFAFWLHAGREPQHLPPIGERSPCVQSS